MSECGSAPIFHSPIGSLMAQFIREKQACGYSYHTGSGALRRFDRFLADQGLTEVALPRDLVEQWIAKQPNESVTTHQARIGLTRRLAVFVASQGAPAYLPPAHLGARGRSRFVPRIFSHDEIRRLFAAADGLQPSGHAPLRYLILPELLRVLYGCGLRVSEALHLRVADVALESGVLTIRQTKFQKDRLVPMTSALTQRLQRYAHMARVQHTDGLFFPAPHTGVYHHSSIYKAFRSLLWDCRIPHGGRGHGPRLHDLRHTYAVHRLAKWYREGADLQAKLPILAAYMGHCSMNETQEYLQLTAEVFPELSTRCETAFGHLIPRSSR
jgi:integrase/recombinase XerD